MTNPQVSNPNDFKVVSFHNSTDFGFTPELGCMYDSRAINDSKGNVGIGAGETMTLPYHIGHRLAVNLAKAVMMRSQSDKPQLDAAGQPIIKSIWNDVELEKLKNSFITDLYSETKPIAQSQTDLLIAKVEEYKKMVDAIINKEPASLTPQVTVAQSPVSAAPVIPTVFQDKQEVLVELEKRGIKHDKRKNKADLEKLFV